MKEVILSKPIRSGDKMLTSLTVRASTVGDEEDAQVMAVDMGRPLAIMTSELCLFAVLTGVSYDDLRAVSSNDWDKLRKAYNEVNRVRPTQPDTGPGEEAPLTN
jgi:hypothetical protein